ncbi:MAG: tetratricopeptide repeat protein [Acidobacteria bacterium]|nr:tetratricopeptide repeat protein [Acidobacteriota bacterium]
MNPSTTLSALALSFPRIFARPLRALCLLFWLPLWLLPSSLVQAQTGVGTSPTAPSQAEERTLKLGEPVERELAGGQQHAYQITLSAGQYLNVVVEQRGIDVVVTLSGPDGKQLLEVDSPNGSQGTEPVLWVAEVGGTYRLEVRSLEKTAKTGRYEAKLNEAHPATASDRAQVAKSLALLEVTQLDAEASTLRNAGQYDKALPLAERALAVCEKALGAEHPTTATSLKNLAELYDDKGDYAKAEPLYQRALAIREKTLGPEHPATATVLNNLALLYCHDKGNYAQAEPYYQRALAIYEKTLGPEHPYTSTALNNLAELYRSKGDYAKAEPLYQRALAIREKTLGPEHPDTATVLNNLALVYESGRDYAKAEPLYQRSMAIKEKTLGPEHPYTAQSFDNLALLYTDKGDYAKAEPLYQRALAILGTARGPNHPDVATVLNNLAVLYKDKGDYAKAGPLYQRALMILEKARGPNHPDVATLLRNLAWLCRANGDIQQAITIAARAAESSEFSLNQTLVIGSERQKLLFLVLCERETNLILSLHKSAPTDSQALKLALTTLLRRKGRGLEAASDAIATLRRRAKPEDQALLDKLVATRSQLAVLTLKGRQQSDPVQFKAQLKQLADEADNLEANLNSRSAELRAQAQPVTIEAIQAALPAEAALIEFATYRAYDAKTKKNGPLHYVTYALAAQGQPRWVELGEAKPIDAAVERLRQALRDKNRLDVKQLARAVDEKVMRPVRALLGQTRHVFISPDGALNLIPFAALVDEHNRYLVQRYDFSYLTSGRDLLRLQVKQPGKQTAMVVANPDFGEEANAGAARQRGLVYHPGTKAATGEGAVLAGYYFPPLQGTAGEARALKAMLTDATVLTQGQATEAALKQVSGLRILHIATHGFFLENQKPAVAEERGLKMVGLEEPMAVGQIENPLLRSGLALAGANRPTSGAGDDGILTAQEAAGLDLWGTKLVVLSACDTGVGEVKNGEGVYGLRRALVLAGSETQVMSLWPVSDKGTRDLMIDYYRRLLRGEERSAALRQVQLRMLASNRAANAQRTARDYSHPYYWASFIQSGEWRKLD